MVFRKFFSNRNAVKMNKPIYLGFSILEISRALMYELWYDYMKPKYKEKEKLCYTDTDSFITHTKQKIFVKILHMMLIKDLTHRIVNAIPLSAINHSL